MFGFEDLPSGGTSAGIDLPETVMNDEPMTEREKALRDLFASEYLVDRDQVKAAMRCGFGYQFAVEYAEKLMKESYVQRQINRFSLTPSCSDEDLEEYNRKRIREGLINEAFYRGPGSSHAARVSALKALAELNGMVSKKAPGDGGGAQGGVMQVPGIANLDNWEDQASASQDNLASHADTGE